MVIKKLKCEACNGTMEIDSEKSILFCPYCGSKELIDDSDDVKIHKIDSESDYKKFEKRFEFKKELIGSLIIFAVAFVLIFLLYKGIKATM